MKSQADYIVDPLHCPACHSSRIDGGSMWVDGTQAFQEIRCQACEQEWTDTYQLTGYHVEVQS